MSSSSAEATAAARAPGGGSTTSATQLFDEHLKVLSDSYLVFFHERKRIEEQYVSSLLKLHRRAKSNEMSTDDRIELTTTRVAWSEITDNIEREAGTHAAFLETLATHVIEPLSNFKEEQDRIRKRIRDDVKDAITAHSEFAENVLPRLKRTYIKKCQETEEYKSMAASAASNPLSPTASIDPTAPTARPNASAANGTRPVVTGPQPLRPLDRRPSQSAHRNRSPSASTTSTALQDLAHQGKRQLNQLMTFLDRDGARTDNALRQVRAKREADEADKEYRKAVHWLETLRIRRVKLLESGFKSCEAFVRESSEIMKKVLEIYTDSLTASAATQSQLCEHGRRQVEKISPQRDSAVLAPVISRHIAASTPKPVYYYNYNVGECKDLIFGVSLVDYATARGPLDGDIPKIVRICIEDIDKRGLDAEGIYRVSGRHAAVQELQHKIERNEAAFAFTPSVDDVYSVASFLKMYLRELPDPVFKFPLQDRIQHTEGIDEHVATNFAFLRSKIRRLPPIHQATLKAVVEHLARVASHSDKNKMDPKNLAIVFGTVIFGEDEMPKGADLLGMQSWKDSLMEDLISNAHALFQQNGSPPLPAAPLNEPAAPVTYGSNHTKVTNMPPPPVPTSPRKHGHQKSSSLSTPRSSVDAPRPILQAPQDFTPQLPPRPMSSIHPSLRAGPQANSPARQPINIRAGQFFDEPVRVQPHPQGSASSHSHDGHTDGASSSLPLPAPFSPRLGDSPSVSTSSISSAFTSSSALNSNSGSAAEPHSREPSSKRSSRQMQIQLSDLPEEHDGAAPPHDLFSPLPPPTSGAHESGAEMSSTAAAAAFASATPSPTSSSHSGQSSPSKRSGHGRKASD